MKVTCTRPNASELINGITFVRQEDDSVVATGVSAEDAAAFTDFEGYVVAAESDDPIPPVGEEPIAQVDEIPVAPVVEEPVAIEPVDDSLIDAELAAEAVAPLGDVTASVDEVVGTKPSKSKK
jgi:hypothetical protein